MKEVSAPGDDVPPVNLQYSAQIDLEMKVKHVTECKY